MDEPGRQALDDIAAYYTRKLAEHGQTARGVDWNGEEGQRLRFAQLTRVIAEEEGLSVNDLGCGYGALHDYLGEYVGRFTYTGCDISADMIAAARARLSGRPGVRLHLGAVPPGIADYGIASGIFNVRVGCHDGDWWDHMAATLDALDRTSARGFAFNCLTSYSDPDRMRADLYYAEPGAVFDHCKRRYARNVALLHDYGLFEFTIIVRKQA